MRPRLGRLCLPLRARRLKVRLTSKAEIISFHKSVMPRGTGAAVDQPVGRTLWHSLYDLKDRSLEISFYLHDDTSGENGQKNAVWSNSFDDELLAKGCRKGRSRIDGKQVRGWEGIELTREDAEAGQRDKIRTHL